jgi:hypothetical protein
MAAVTLKDLMSPLNYIEEYTKQTSQKLDRVVALLARNGGSARGDGGTNINVNQKNVDAIKALGEGVGPLIKSLALIKLIPNSSINKLGQIITTIGESLSTIEDPNNALKVAEVVQVIGNNILLFAISLTLATPLLILSVPGAIALGISIRLLFAAVGEIDPAQVDNLKTVVNELSLGIFAYSLIMAGVSYIAPAIIAGSLAIGISIRIFLGILGNMEGVDKKLNAVETLSRTALAYSIGMAATAILAPLVLVGSIVFGLSVRLLVFAIGKTEKTEKSLQSLSLLGLSVIGFVIGMAITGYLGIDVLKGTLLFTASLIVLNLGLRIAGDKTTTKGALALALIGPAAIIFSLSMVFVSSIIGDDFEKFIIPTLVIGITAAAFYLIGKGAKEIALGALAFAAIGLSLLVFNMGYIPFIKTVNTLTPESFAAQVGVLAAFGVGFVALGTAIAATGGVAFLAPLLYAASGVALIALAAGLKAIKSVNFDEKDSTNLSYTLGAVAMAFSGVDPEDGFFANVGNVFSRLGQSAAGVAAAAFYTAAGVSLLTLSKGLSAFKAIKFTEADSKELAMSLSAVTTGFALAGGGAQVPSTSFFGQMFGFKANVVEQGIRSVRNAGSALKNIADGLSAFQDLIKQKVTFGEPDTNGKYQEGTLGYAITNTLGFVQSAFSAIGKEGDEADTGFFGALGFKQNVVQKGIQAVQGAGTELTNIANGLTKFIELTDKNIDFSPEGKLAKSISNTLTFVGTAFASIGGMTQETEWLGFTWDQNKVGAGVKAVKGAGAELTNIATGLTKFIELTDKNIDFSAEGKLAKAISSTLSFVGEAFSQIGGKKQKKKGWFGFEWDENAVNAGVKAVKGAGAELNNIANGLTKFEGIQDADALGKKISTLLTSMSTSFTSLYKTNPKINDRMSKVATFVTQVGNQATKGALDKAADGFQGIADAINSVELEKANAMGDLFKGASKLSSDAKAYQKLVEAVEEIRDVLTGDKQNATQGGGFMQSVLPTAQVAPVTPKPGSPAQTAQATDARLLAALEKINSTMANLPSAIAAIEIKVRD